MPDQISFGVEVVRSCLERGFGVGDRVELLVNDGDSVGCATGGLGMLGRDDDDRLALVADLIPGEDRLIRELEPVGLLSRNVLVGEHGPYAG